MLSFRLICVASAMIVSCSRCPADEFLLHGDVGHVYAEVRKHLIDQGNTPIDMASNRNRQCDGAEDICATYEELAGCAIDRDSPCRFEWKSHSGRRFYIITSGSDPQSLKVMGMDYDEPGDD
jgi:hypothetical protein